MTDGVQQPNGSVTEQNPTPAPVVDPNVAPAQSLVNQAPAPAAAPAAAAPVVEPLTAEAITIPEGLTLDNDSMTTFLTVMNDAAMTPQARAQALIDLQASLSAKSSEMGSQAWNDQQTAWQAEISADPVLGGANLEATIAGIGNLMNRFATPEVREAFNTTGAGNNPHIVRFLHTLVSQLKEPAPLPLGGPASAPTRSAAELIYNKPATT